MTVFGRKLDFKCGISLNLTIKITQFPHQDINPLLKILVTPSQFWLSRNINLPTRWLPTPQSTPLHGTCISPSSIWARQSIQLKWGGPGLWNKRWRLVRLKIRARSQWYCLENPTMLILIILVNFVHLMLKLIHHFLNWHFKVFFFYQ